MNTEDLDAELRNAWNAWCSDLAFGVSEARRLQGVAERAGNAAALSEAMVLEGYCLTLGADWAAGEAMLVQGSLLAAAQSQTWPMTIGASRLATAWSRRGMLAEGLQHLEAAVSSLPECPDQRDIDELNTTIGLLYLRSDRPREAIRAFARTLRSWRTKQPKLAQSIVAGNLGSAMILAGRARAARRLLAGFWNESRQEEASASFHYLATTLAKAHVAMGEVAQATRWLDVARKMPLIEGGSIWRRYEDDVARVLARGGVGPLAAHELRDLVLGAVVEAPPGARGEDERRDADWLSLRLAAARSSFHILQARTAVDLAEQQRLRLDESIERVRQSLTAVGMSERDEPLAVPEQPFHGPGEDFCSRTFVIESELVVSGMDGQRLGHRANLRLRAEPGRQPLALSKSYWAQLQAAGKLEAVTRWYLAQAFTELAVRRRSANAWVSLDLEPAQWRLPALSTWLQEQAERRDVDLHGVRLECAAQAVELVQAEGSPWPALVALGCTCVLGQWPSLAALPDARHGLWFQRVVLDMSLLGALQAQAGVGDMGLLAAWVAQVRSRGMGVGVRGLPPGDLARDLLACGVSEFQWGA